MSLTMNDIPGEKVGRFELKVLSDMSIMTVKIRLLVAVRKTIMRSTVMKYIIRRNKSICCCVACVIVFNVAYIASLWFVPSRGFPTSCGGVLASELAMTSYTPPS